MQNATNHLNNFDSTDACEDSLSGYFIHHLSVKRKFNLIG